MRSTTTLLTAAATLLASTAQARIVGFYAPQNAAPNADVKIEIFTEGYPQTINDVAISFGLTPLESLFMGSLGTFVSTKALGPGKNISSPLPSFFFKEVLVTNVLGVLLLSPLV